MKKTDSSPNTLGNKLTNLEEEDLSDYLKHQEEQNEKEKETEESQWEAQSLGTKRNLDLCYQHLQLSLQFHRQAMFHNSLVPQNQNSPGLHSSQSPGHLRLNPISQSQSRKVEKSLLAAAKKLRKSYANLGLNHPHVKNSGVPEELTY